MIKCKLFFLGFFCLIVATQTPQLVFSQTDSGPLAGIEVTELAPSVDGPYFEGPIYWGFSDFSADAAKIEDKLVSVINAEAKAARAAGLTHFDKDWPAAAVYVTAYSFTSKKLADALIRAAKSGCEVTVVMDKKQSQGKGSLASFLALNGVAVYLDTSHNAMHSKYIICLSQDAVYTGSYNFTENAKKNAENIVGLVGNPFLVMMYLRDFMEHVGHAKQLVLSLAKNILLEASWRNWSLPAIGG